jgi:hypothetical protein
VSNLTHDLNAEHRSIITEALVCYFRQEENVSIFKEFAPTIKREKIQISEEFRKARRKTPKHTPTVVKTPKQTPTEVKTPKQTPTGVKTPKKMPTAGDST